MKLQNVKVSETKRSAFNIRPASDFEGPAFDELVASVREKGVLVPVLARPLKGRDRTGKFEVVAGNRRLAAAKAAGLKEIPAYVGEFTDPEAREAQIVENLQREDVHPLEEGAAYRWLIEEQRREIRDVAAKVGKSEGYVRQRLFLTNLAPAPAGAYRAGEISDGHAVLIAKLPAAEDQALALKHATDGWRRPSVKELEEWIKKTFHASLAFQPWLSDKEAAKVVGPCKECPPNRATLFGEAKEGQCTSTVCWTRKMQLYVTHRRRKNPKLVPVTKEYGPTPKGVLSMSNYASVASSHEYAEEAIVAAGPDIGKTLWICRDKKCRKHSAFVSDYRPSEQEKAKRRAALKRDAARKDRTAKTLAAAAAKVKWPLDRKRLGALMECVLRRAFSDTVRNLVKQKGWEILRSKRFAGDKSTYPDYEKSLVQAAEKMTDPEKLRLVFEILISDIPEWNDRRKKVIGMLLQ